MPTENLIFAFLLTLFAGLSTGIGSCFALFHKKINGKFLSVSLGFSGGVMVYVSFAEIFPKAKDILIESQGIKMGSWITVLSFFGGMLLIALIDKLVPNFENPHEPKDVILMDSEGESMNKKHKTKLLRMGMMSALAIGIHNFPEGLTTFLSAIKDFRFGIPIAIAVAIHNIPEGIAVAVPIYFATESRKKAFKLSFLSGISEPIGALVGYFLLLPFMSPLLFGILFAGVAGIMVFISMDQLLPTAEKYGEHHLSIYGFVSGMVIMALSLLFFI